MKTFYRHCISVLLLFIHLYHIIFFSILLICYSLSLFIFYLALILLFSLYELCNIINGALFVPWACQKAEGFRLTGISSSLVSHSRQTASLFMFNHLIRLSFWETDQDRHSCFSIICVCECVLESICLWKQTMPVRSHCKSAWSNVMFSPVNIVFLLV